MIPADPELSTALCLDRVGSVVAAGVDEEATGRGVGRAGSPATVLLTPPLPPLDATGGACVGWGGCRSSSWNTLMPARSLCDGARREEAGGARETPLRAS